jgi:hypothetical protein
VGCLFSSVVFVVDGVEESASFISTSAMLFFRFFFSKRKQRKKSNEGRKEEGWCCGYLNNKQKQDKWKRKKTTLDLSSPTRFHVIIKVVVIVLTWKKFEIFDLKRSRSREIFVLRFEIYSSWDGLFVSSISFFPLFKRIDDLVDDQCFILKFWEKSFCCCRFDLSFINSNMNHLPILHNESVSFRSNTQSFGSKIQRHSNRFCKLSISIRKK